MFGHLHNDTVKHWLSHREPSCDRKTGHEPKLSAGVGREGERAGTGRQGWPPVPIPRGESARTPTAAAAAGSEVPALFLDDEDGMVADL